VAVVQDLLSFQGRFPRNTALYGTAFEKVRRLRAAVRNPGRLIEDLDHELRLDVWVGRSHGDLHLKNLRVRDNTAEMVMIDFACAKSEAPVSYDAAELEVSLAFGKPVPGEQPLSPEQLDQLYRDRLFATRPSERNATPVASRSSRSVGR
jgi:hypothetical protein